MVSKRRGHPHAGVSHSALCCPPSGGSGVLDSSSVCRLATCPGCLQIFAIHLRCDRGHVYCGKACAAAARRASIRRARQRLRRSAEGRQDHRDRQRARRARLRDSGGPVHAPPPRVGDHGYIPAQDPLTPRQPSVQAPSSQEPSNAGEEVQVVFDLHAPRAAEARATPSAAIRCVVCGGSTQYFDVGSHRHRVPRRLPRLNRRP